MSRWFTPRSCSIELSSLIKIVEPQSRDVDCVHSPQTLSYAEIIYKDATTNETAPDNSLEFGTFSYLVLVA